MRHFQIGFQRIFYGETYSKILLRYSFPVFTSIFIFRLFSNPDLGREPIDSDRSANVRFRAHNRGLEVTVLKGRSSEVKAFADHVIAERGVRHHAARKRL
jgi:NikR C terminal nickel binding domain